jgi:uncharacterized membrane protein YjgN (DUF898 family)
MLPARDTSAGAGLLIRAANEKEGAMDAAPGHTMDPPSPFEQLRLSWSPPAGLIGLSVINFLLRLVTLGIYYFWGKTEVRRRIWSATRVNGEPLAYTGTGGELFLGFLIVFGVVLLPMLLLTVAAAIAFGQQSPAPLLVYVAVFFLVGVGIHRAQRYRLARTNWRGIRFALEGSSWAYGWTHFWTALLIPLTLGWIMPWRTTKLQGLISNGMRFGDRPFRFTATSGALYPRFALAWFGAIGLLLLLGAIGAVASLPAIEAAQSGGLYQPQPRQVAIILVALFAAVFLWGIISAWYRAKLFNHFAANTFIEGATFSARATAGSLVWLMVSNYLLTLFTFGLLTPVAQARSAGYLVQRLTIHGDLPLSEIEQRAADAIRRGEGLAQAFDVDAF